ncbi:MAG: family 78 glycoside hydrolase catalytic domain [Bacteroidota bacterium]
MTQNTQLLAVANCQYFRLSFHIDGSTSSAKLLFALQGNGIVYLNSTNQINHNLEFTWSSHNQRVLWRESEVTDVVMPGENHIGIVLNPGYYAGRLPFANNWHPYGREPRVSCWLELQCADGTKEKIDLSKGWKKSTGPILSSGIYDGEIYDARLEQDWLSPTFDDSDWETVDLPTIDSTVQIVPNTSVPIRRIDTLYPQSLDTLPNGDWLLDMGQNMVGWMQFEVEGPRGSQVVLEHAEVLDQNGNWYNKNLRSAKQRIEYTLKGGTKEVYEPHFTYMGFRYVRIVKHPNKPKLEDFRGIVVHADMPRTGHFSCQDSLVNRLYQNIIWSQKGNYMAVPTDCPQRDERLGWTGDVQVFARTAAYNYDVLPFLKNWLIDLRLDQNANGDVPWTIPKILLGEGAAGWGDVAVLLPWDLYVMYGDTSILVDQFESMRSWVDLRNELAGSDNLLQNTSEFGDWLAYRTEADASDKPGYTDTDFIATAYLAHANHILAKIAGVLGKAEEETYYFDRFTAVKTAFQKEYLTPSGRLSPNTQTSYVLALYFDLIPVELQQSAVDYLIRNIENRGMHLSTGYLGTGLLNVVLTRFGRSDIAYKLLLQKSYPSWLYPVTREATTIWERWDGIKPDGGFGSDFMNSFNHTPLGAVGRWLYESVAGIRPIESAPGFKEILFAPHPHPKMLQAEGSFQSRYGLISSSWQVRGDSIYLEMMVPEGTTARLTVPSNYAMPNDTLSLGVGLNKVTLPFEFYSAFDRKISFRKLWQDPDQRSLLLAYFPELAQKTEREIRRMFIYTFDELLRKEITIFKEDRLRSFEVEMLLLLQQQN